MKKIITTIIAAAAIATAQADLFRVSFYQATENGYVGRDGRLVYVDPAGDGVDQHFRYTATAKTQCEAYCKLIKKYPDAVEVDVIHLDLE